MNLFISCTHNNEENKKNKGIAKSRFISKRGVPLSFLFSFQLLFPLIIRLVLFLYDYESWKRKAETIDGWIPVSIPNPL